MPPSGLISKRWVLKPPAISASNWVPRKHTKTSKRWKVTGVPGAPLQMIWPIRGRCTSTYERQLEIAHARLRGWRRGPRRVPTNLWTPWTWSPNHGINSQWHKLIHNLLASCHARHGPERFARQLKTALSTLSNLNLAGRSLFDISWVLFEALAA